jgi:dipeptidyl aminopeptidase/acylaminoacyl peptidase
MARLAAARCSAAEDWAGPDSPASPGHVSRGHAWCELSAGRLINQRCRVRRAQSMIGPSPRTASLVLLAVGVVGAFAPPGASAASPGRNGSLAFTAPPPVGYEAPYPQGSSAILGLSLGTRRVQPIARFRRRFNPLLCDPLDSGFAFKPGGEALALSLAGWAGGSKCSKRYEDNPALYLASLRGRRQTRPLTQRFNRDATRATDEFPDWSPDGRSVVFTRLYQRRTPAHGPCARTGDRCVRVYHRGRSRALAVGAFPTWSARNWIAFVRNRNEIWVRRPDLRGLRRILTTGPGTDVAWLDWSPDGRRLVFEYAPSDVDRVIATVSASGSDLRVLRSGERPRYSPNGRWIAFLRFAGAGGDRTLCVTSTVGRGTKCLRRTGWDRGLLYGGLDWQPLSRRRGE